MIDFEIAFSPVAFLGLSVLHLLALISVLLSPLPAAIELLLVAAVIASVCLMLEDYGKHARNRVHRCSISSHGSLLSYRGESRQHSLPRCLYLGEYLLVLEFGGEIGSLQSSHKRRLILTADAVSAADFCRLQRYLRFEI